MTIDLLVADKNGKPVEDLRPEEIKVFENGKEQKVLHFEHVNGRQRQAPRIEHAGWVDNLGGELKYGAPQASIILLLDALNVAPPDESRARKYMLETLEKFPPGQKVAVFLLSNRAIQLTGFTDDPKVLHAVVEKVSLRHPSVLDTPDLVNELGVHAELADKDTSGYLAGASQILKDIQMFATERISATADLRVNLTLDALEQIAQISGGLPGRKNLVWLSDSFPLNIGPPSSTSADVAAVEFNSQRDYSSKVKKTAAHLTASRVAVYPVKIEGLTSYDKAENSQLWMPEASRNPGEYRPQYSSVFDAGIAPHEAAISSIKAIAEQTGGRGYFNTNNFSGAIEAAMADGTDYYVVDYSPSNKRQDSTPRGIDIKSSRAGLQLRYRRSYIPLPETEAAAADLEQALNPTLPTRDGIEIAANREPCNGNLLALAIAPGDLQLGKMSDGRKIAQLSVGYIAVPTNLKNAPPLRSIKDLDIPLDLTQMEAAQKAGVPLTLRLDVPEGDYRTRVGIYDRNSRRSGSLDVDFSNRPCTAQASAPPENVMPEEGTLGEGIYENRYYGVRMDIPRVNAIRRQRLRLMPTGIHALLALEIENRMHTGYLVAYATDASSGDTVDALQAANEEVKNAAKQGKNVLAGPMERSGRQGRFWVVVEQGPDPLRRTLIYFIPRREALLKFAATSDDDEMFKNMSISFGHLFFTEGRVAKNVEHEYMGPTIPAKLVDDAIATRPGAGFADAGLWKENAYLDPTLGLEFPLPKGWEALDAQAGEALYERMHAPAVDDKSGVREHALFRACSKPLFFLHEQKEGAEAQTASLFVVDQHCMKVQFPAAENVAKMGDFASGLSLFQEFGEARSAGMVKVNDRSFVTLQGELSFAGPDPKLQKRSWQKAYVTPFHDKLLIWFWSYPRSGMKDDAVVTNIHMK